MRASAMVGAVTFNAGLASNHVLLSEAGGDSRSGQLHAAGMEEGASRTMKKSNSRPK